MIPRSAFILLAHVAASPISSRQAVTEIIAPPESTAAGCIASFPTAFGIAVMNVSTTNIKRQSMLMGTVSQIGDGQVQGGMHTDSFDPPTSTMPPVTQIGDDQIQAAATSSCASDSVTMSSFTQLANATRRSVLEQACSYSSSLSAAPSATLLPATNNSTSAPSAFIASPTNASTSAPTATPQPAARLSLVSCLTNSTLRLSLGDNNLYDAFNRTGYIASNFQFQFDGPPQSGAMYTSGWSICPVGNSTDDGVRTLALGGQTTFWQCLSGSFYNLYTENWAAQCSPVELRVVRFETCE